MFSIKEILGAVPGTITINKNNEKKQRGLNRFCFIPRSILNHLQKIYMAIAKIKSTMMIVVTMVMMMVKRLRT